MTKKKAITLLSAGLDSTVATYLAMKKFSVAMALTFDYGQRAAKKEIACASLLAKDLKIDHEVIELPWLSRFTKTSLVNRGGSIPEVNERTVEKKAANSAKSVWVPNRNAVFIAIAAAIAESEGIAAVIAGFNADEAKTFPDNSKKFLNAQNLALSFSTKQKVEIVSPTISMTKKDIAREFLRLGLERASIWTCYEGFDSPCGKCESCVRDDMAFRAVTKSAKVVHNR